MYINYLKMLCCGVGVYLRILYGGKSILTKVIHYIVIILNEIITDKRTNFSIRSRLCFSLKELLQSYNAKYNNYSYSIIYINRYIYSNVILTGCVKM